jgi:hypothetical protein
LRGRNACVQGRGQDARGGKLEVHYAVPETKACVTRPCGLRAIGADKGYTEVFTDSDGQRHGQEFGAMRSAMTDKNAVRYQGRQTLAAIADKHLVKGRYRKYARIVKHNLGKQKIVRQKRCHRAEIRTKVFTATHALNDKAAVLVVGPLASDRRLRSRQEHEPPLIGLGEGHRPRSGNRNFPPAWSVGGLRQRSVYLASRSLSPVLRTAWRRKASLHDVQGGVRCGQSRGGKHPRPKGRCGNRPLHTLPTGASDPRDPVPPRVTEFHSARRTG